ncbi:hypothetical protein IV64_GL002762 [Lactiplantibacillus xiangfangensis]|uniref:Uncharacterized protein n=1 Tax=Lactiplantibacillus xiangfangensis TaxID=942150 RepID=A0A0R2MCC0_9LACO|nr:hypothetical protein IV64_GL002762 [Lactiplantibacillus xiangfangensis]
MQKAQLLRTVRGLRPENHRSNTTVTTDVISGDLRWSDINNNSKTIFSGVG